MPMLRHWQINLLPLESSLRAAQRSRAGHSKTYSQNPADQTPPENVEKFLHLRSKYHLALIRFVWYLAHYHGIKTSPTLA